MHPGLPVGFPAGLGLGGVEEGASGVGDAGDIGVGDFLKMSARGRRAGGIAAGQPVAELGHGADADAGEGIIQAGPQRVGQRRGDDRGPGGVAGEQDLSYAAKQPAVRGLRRARRLDLVET